MPAQNLRFVLHEHKSSQLHYYFRLEVDGVLKSWAIPNGPSLNHADKRLAVMTPDHILEYIDFEESSPRVAMAGSVRMRDKGEYVPLETDDPNTALQNGKLSFELKGQKLKGHFYPHQDERPAQRHRQGMAPD
jgi:bifunctional non-homologous end joining protein LigD